MRYTNLQVDFVDRDFIDFTNGEHEGNLILCGTTELIELTNNLRKEQGNEDLVGVDYDNDVYYNFYLMFDATKKEVSIQAVCNHGEKDDEVWYKLPMTNEEESNVMFILINCLARELYNS